MKRKHHHHLITFLAALCIMLSVQSFKALSHEVDIGLFQADSTTLEVRLKADKDFSNIVSNVAFTIRWKEFTGAHLGKPRQQMPEQAYIPMSKSGKEQTENGYRYQVFAGFGMNAMDKFNENWQQGDEVVIMEIPVKDALGTFQIINDQWTGNVENNGDFYVSLNGRDRTGQIYHSTVDFCQHLSAQTTSTDVSCKNGDDGSAKVEIAGSNSSFTAQWSSGHESHVASSLKAGNYEVTVYEEGGCVLTDQVKIQEPTYSLSSPVILNQRDTLRGYHPSGKKVSYTWYLNHQRIKTADDNILRIDKSGRYFLVAQDTNGCRKASDTVSVDLTSIQDQNGGQRVLQVMPNPNDGQFRINVNATATGKSLLEISNPLGQVVFRKKIQGHFNEKLDFRELSNGVYLVKLRGNEQTHVRKVVMQ